MQRPDDEDLTGLPDVPKVPPRPSTGQKLSPPDLVRTSMMPDSPEEQAARALMDEIIRVRQISLIPALLAALEAIPRPVSRAVMTMKCALVLPEANRAPLLNSGRALLHSLAENNPEGPPSRFLVTLLDHYAQHSPGGERSDLVEQAIKLVRRVEAHPERAQMLLVLSRWFQGDRYTELFDEAVGLLDTMQTNRLQAWAAQEISQWAFGIVLPWVNVPMSEHPVVCRTIAAAAGLSFFRRPADERAVPPVTQSPPLMGIPAPTPSSIAAHRMTAREISELADQVHKAKSEGE
jgi:hypothetical protein